MTSSRLGSRSARYSSILAFKMPGIFLSPGMRYVTNRAFRPASLRESRAPRYISDRQWRNVRNRDPLVLRSGFCQKIAEGLFKNRTGPRAQEKKIDVPVARVKNCLRHGAGPGRIHPVIERVEVDSRFLPVIRKMRLRARDKTANEIHVGIIIHVDADHADTLGLEFGR